jgi:hypothetical protein
MRGDVFDQVAEEATRVAKEARARAANGHDPAGSDQGPEGQEKWGEPDLSILNSAHEPAPPLPKDVLGEFWAGYITAAAAEKSAPPDFVALPLLSEVGAILANVRHGSPWAGWSEPPVLNTVAVGKPSSSKSPGADVARDLAAELEQDWNTDFEERERQYRTRKAEAEVRRETWENSVKAAVKDDKPSPLEPKEAKAPDPPEPRRLVIADVTVEKAARLAAANPRGLLLMRDELSGWIGSMDRYGAGQGGDRAFWLEAYGGRPFVVDRVKEARPVRIPHLAIGITGGVQPDRLPLLLGGADDGQAARFIYAWPERIQPARPAAHANHKAAFRCLRRLRDLPMGKRDEKVADSEPVPKVLPFAETAAETIQEWRVQVAAMEEGVEGLFCSWLGKLPGMAVRLAVVLEHLWWCAEKQPNPFPAAISERAAVAAIGFLEAYAIPMARRAFGDAARSQPERDAITLVKWLADSADSERLPGAVNARELRHIGVLPEKNPVRYEAALARLEGLNWVRPAPARQGENKGRPRKDWAINPRLRERLP